MTRSVALAVCRYSDPDLAGCASITDPQAARILYVRAGSGHAQFDHQSEEVKSHYLVLVRAGQAHSFSFQRGEPLDCFLVRIRTADHGLPLADMAPLVHVPQAHQEPLAALLEEAAVACARGGEPSADLAPRLLAIIRALAIGNRVLFAARHQGRSPRNTSRHAHPSETQLDYFHGGTGRLWLADSWKEIRPGDLFVIPPGTEHEIVYDPEADFDNYSVKLNLTRDSRLDSEPMRLVVGGADRDRLAGILRTIVGMHVMDSAVGDDTIERLIDEVVSLRDRAVEVPKNGAEKIARVKELIEANYALPLTLGWIAQRVSLRPEYVSRLFKKLCGANLSTFMRKVRLEAARKLIESTELPITRIARDCGFGDVYYFSASFKRCYGESPSVARRRLRKQAAG